MASEMDIQPRLSNRQLAEEQLLSEMSLIKLHQSLMDRSTTVASFSDYFYYRATRVLDASLMEGPKEVATSSTGPKRSMASSSASNRAESVSAGLSLTTLEESSGAVDDKGVRSRTARSLVGWEETADRRLFEKELASGIRRSSLSEDWLLLLRAGVLLRVASVGCWSSSPTDACRMASESCGM
eukprot:gene21594-27632_t